MEYHKYANIFPMIEGEDFESLKKDIKVYGLLTPIVSYEGKILDGRNRFKACKEIGLKPTIEAYTGDFPLDFVISLNLKRRHLTKQQAACAAVRNEELMEELSLEAKKRQGERSDLTSDKKLTEVNKPTRADQTAADMFHTNRQYINEAKRIKEESPEVFEEIEKGRLTFQEYGSERKKMERLDKIAAQRKAIKENSPQLPKGTYEVIVIDPPWRYFDEDGTNYNPDNWQTRGVAPYPTMTIEEISKIKIPASDDCVLWLWTTHRHMRYCFKLLDEWGFEEKAILTWCKNKMGIGRWLRSKSEFCIMAVKGKPTINLTNQTTVLNAINEAHSIKPKEFYEMVDELCIGRKLDYFARKKREGWDVFGDEVKDGD